MAIIFNCKCGKRFQARDEDAGKKTHCPACRQLVVIPAPASEEFIEAELVETAAGEEDDEGGAYTLKAEDAALPTRLRGDSADTAGVVGPLGCFKLSRHHKAATHLVFSTDGRKALAAVDCTVVALDVKNGDVIGRFRQHDQPVLCAAFSPSGRRALSGAEGGPLRLWEVETGEEVDYWHGPHRSVESVAFSPNGHYALSGGADGTMCLWEVREGTQIYCFEGRSPTRIYCVAFSPDGRLALAAGAEGSIRIWEVKTGRLFGRLQGATGNLSAVAFSPDGRQVLAADRRTLSDTGLAVWKWDLASGQLLPCFENPDKSPSPVYCVAVAPKGNRVLAAGGIENHTTGGPGRWFDEEDKAGGRTRTPDRITGEKIVAGMAHSIPVRLWDVQTGRILQTYEGHLRKVRSLAISPDGRTALSGAADGTVRVWGLPLEVPRAKS